LEVDCAGMWTIDTGISNLHCWLGPTRVFCGIPFLYVLLFKFAFKMNKPVAIQAKSDDWAWGMGVLLVIGGLVFLGALHCLISKIYKTKASARPALPPPPPPSIHWYGVYHYGAFAEALPLQTTTASTRPTAIPHPPPIAKSTSSA
jgi:hypothetical protein